MWLYEKHFFPLSILLFSLQISDQVSCALQKHKSILMKPSLFLNGPREFNGFSNQLNSYSEARTLQESKK